MDEAISHEKLVNCLANTCVFCENLDYNKRDYDTLCYQHKRKLLWG